MKLSEKLKYLREESHLSQDDLADKCNVSRQAISKWESNLSLPDIDNLIILSNLFNISIDTLIKDDLSVSGVIKNESCHKVLDVKVNGYYEGLLIKESITDENILDILDVNKVELWKTSDKPKYWTALYFTSSDIDLPNKISKVMASDIENGGNWYVDFKHANTKYIVFKDKILSYTIGNISEKELVAEECKKMGILSINNISE